MPRGTSSIDRSAVFAAGLMVAIGGLIYELILGTAASYLFGDSVVSFSLATGVSLFGMGIGSLLSTKLTTRAARNFAVNELVLGLVGGNSVLLLFAAYSLTPLYWLVFIGLSLVIGIGIGIEIPLLVSLLQARSGDESQNLLSKVLALDYFGALIASLVFPFILLPYLGVARAAYAVALLNLIIALYMFYRLGIRARAYWTTVAGVVTLLVLFAFTTRIEAGINARAFSDPVVYQDASQYQRIVITHYQRDTRLYLNNQLQFSSIDEARYHETLAHAALTSTSDRSSVLILGGGDGLLVREALKYPSVTDITLVDLDPAVTDLAKNNRLLTALNGNSLNDRRVRVVNSDALTYVNDEATPVYNAILVDLVDPSNERVSKLYSVEFYRQLFRHLQPDGVFITQATSSYFTPNAMAIVEQTVSTASPERTMLPLIVNVPSFGEWGFVMSTPSSQEVFSRPPPQVEYATTAALHRAREVGDEARSVRRSTQSAPVNTLLHPRLYTAYQADMRQWRY